MKSMFKVFALVAVMTLSGVAFAADEAKPAEGKAVKADKPKVARSGGKFVKLDGATLVVAGKDGAEKKFTTTDATAVMIDGKEAKLADLKEGQMLGLTLDAADATKVTKVVVAAPKPKKEGGEKKPAGEKAPA